MEVKDISRFWGHVKKAGLNDCWLWQGSKTDFGHGCFFVDGKTTGAHRFAYVLVNGEIPPGLVICHKCDVPNCVNPAHLWADTASANAKDMWKKNRADLGKNHHEACTCWHCSKRKYALGIL